MARRNESKYRYNDELCPHCGMRYGAFKTGLTYNEAFLQLWSSDEDPETWRYKKRRTVLGYFHMLKKKMWKDHISFCEQEKQFSFIQEPTEESLDEAVPF